VTWRKGLEGRKDFALEKEKDRYLDHFKQRSRNKQGIGTVYS
jgi:hypothetical protein